MRKGYVTYRCVFGIARRLWEVWYAQESDEGAVRPARMPGVGQARAARVRVTLSDGDGSVTKGESQRA